MITQSTISELISEISDQSLDHPVLQSDLDAAVAECERLKAINLGYWDTIQRYIGANGMLQSQNNVLREKVVELAVLKAKVARLEQEAE